MVAHFGTGPGFAIDSAGFLVTALTVAAIAAPPTRAAMGGVLQQIGGGLLYAWRDPALRAVLIGLAVVDTALTGPVSVGLPTLARERLGGAASLGAMSAAFAAGAVLGNLLGGSFSRRGRLGVVLALLMVAIGASAMAIGVAPGLPVAAAIMFVIAVLSGYAQVLFFAWLQRRTSPEMQGRVQGMVLLASIGLAPFTMAASGAIAQVHLSLLFALAGGAVVVTGLAASLSRAFREL